MTNRRGLIVAIVVAVVIVGAGFVALRNAGGGGQERAFAVTVSGNRMAPQTITVKQNDSVTLTVTVDRDEEIHLHGYDLKHEIKAGGSATYQFKADKSGNFDIEIEDSSTTIGHLVVNQ